MRTVIECVPNVSKGADSAPGGRDRRRGAGVPGRASADVSSDASHNRSVLTFVGDAAAVRAAVAALFEAALPRIDLTRHRGEHPRMGAVDVVPFIPIRGANVGTASRSPGGRRRNRVAASGSRLPLRRLGVVGVAAQSGGDPERGVRGARAEDEATRSGSPTSARTARTRRPAPSPSGRDRLSSPTTSTSGRRTCASPTRSRGPSDTSAAASAS